MPDLTVLDRLGDVARFFDFVGGLLSLCDGARPVVSMEGLRRAITTALIGPFFVSLDVLWPEDWFCCRLQGRRVDPRVVVFRSHGSFPGMESFLGPPGKGSQSSFFLMFWSYRPRFHVDPCILRTAGRCFPSIPLHAFGYVTPRSVHFHLKALRRVFFRPRGRPVCFFMGTGRRGPSAGTGSLQAALRFLSKVFRFRNLRSAVP